MTTATVTGLETSERSGGASKATVGRAIELLFGDCDPHEFDELYTSGFRYHEPRPELAGVGGHRHICEDVLAGFSDVELRVISMEATTERVTTHFTLRGRHTGTFEGNEPTGRQIEARGLFVHRIEGGRIAEAWTVLRWG